MKQRHPHNVQTRLSPEHMAFVLSLADKPADGIRRAIDLARLSVEASRNPDPAAQLAYYLDRAVAMLTTMRSAQQPPTLAGSTTAPGQPIPAGVASPATTTTPAQAAPAQPAAPAGDGFEGWD